MVVVVRVGVVVIHLSNLDQIHLMIRQHVPLMAGKLHSFMATHIAYTMVLLWNLRRLVCRLHIRLLIHKDRGKFVQVDPGELGWRRTSVFDQ